MAKSKREDLLVFEGEYFPKKIRARLWPHYIHIDGEFSQRFLT